MGCDKKITFDIQYIYIKIYGDQLCKIHSMKCTNLKMFKYQEENCVKQTPDIKCTDHSLSVTAW